jgi:hypothetical protein
VPPTWFLPLLAFLILLMGLGFSYSSYRAAAVRRISDEAELAPKQRRMVGLFRWLVVEWGLFAFCWSLGDARWLGAKPSLTEWLTVAPLATVPIVLILWTRTYSRLQQAGRD